MRRSAIWTAMGSMNCAAPGFRGGTIPLRASQEPPSSMRITGRHHLWRIDLGINIREGEHYTQFMVYDLDGDGRPRSPARRPTARRMDREDHRRPQKDCGHKRREISGTDGFWTDRNLLRSLTAGPGPPENYGLYPGRDPIDGWGGIGATAAMIITGTAATVSGLYRLSGRQTSKRGNVPRRVRANGAGGLGLADGKLTSRWVFDSGSVIRRSRMPRRIPAWGPLYLRGGCGRRRQG